MKLLLKAYLRRICGMYWPMLYYIQHSCRTNGQTNASRKFKKHFVSRFRWNFTAMILAFLLALPLCCSLVPFLARVIHIYNWLCVENHDWKFCICRMVYGVGSYRFVCDIRARWMWKLKPIVQQIHAECCLCMCFPSNHSQSDRSMHFRNQNIYKSFWKSLFPYHPIVWAG